MPGEEIHGEAAGFNNFKTTQGPGTSDPHAQLLANINDTVLNAIGGLLNAL